ncbi:MAG TPA: hypothetical protein VGJ69_16260 [Pyrinomonadaceae bacterium]
MDPATNLQQYALLRTILDSLETGALRFYMGAGSQAERDANFKYLKDKLTPIIDHIWAKPTEIDCPDGYHDCDGYCVSYPCTN